MDEGDDLQTTPGPFKKRSVRGETCSLPSTTSLSSRSGDSCDNKDLESHKNGRMSPSKQMAQMAQLEDQENAVVFHDLDVGS